MCDIRHAAVMSDNAVKFLFRRCFKRSVEAVTDLYSAIGAAMDAAYTDATGRAFRHGNAGDNTVRQAKDEAEGALRNHVELLLGSDTNVVYDRNHRCACNGLCEIYDRHNLSYNHNPGHDLDAGYFTVGNAQKWVNMTMKYLYIICGFMYKLGHGITELGVAVMRTGGFFHIPIDNSVLRGLKDRLGNIEFGGGDFIDRQGNECWIKYRRHGDGYAVSADGDLETSWSRITDYGIYEAFRNNGSVIQFMRELSESDMWPIEWEANNWDNH